MKLIEILKESYKKTLTEPRLSGKLPEENWLMNKLKEIDRCSDIDGLSEVSNSIRENGILFLLRRIEAWENEASVKMVNGEWVKDEGEKLL